MEIDCKHTDKQSMAYCLELRTWLPRETSGQSLTGEMFTCAKHKTLKTDTNL
jgi:hypothetical protein